MLAAILLFGVVARVLVIAEKESGSLSKAFLKSVALKVREPSFSVFTPNSARYLFEVPKPDNAVVVYDFILFCSVRISGSPAKGPASAPFKPR